MVYARANACGCGFGCEFEQTTVVVEMVFGQDSGLWGQSNQRRLSVGYSGSGIPAVSAHG